ALGDSAENPHYIETLAKRGYRFVAPVERLDQDSPVISKGPIAPETLPPLPIPAPPIGESQSRRENHLPGMSILALATGILVVVALGIRIWQSTVPVKPMLLPFTQITSSDSIFPGDVGIERFPALLTDGSRLYFS